MGLAAEDLLSDDLKKGGRFRVWNMRDKVVGELHVASDLRWSDNCAIAKLSTVIPGEAAVDFVGPGRRVYQVTVSRDRSFDLGPMETLLVACGYLVQNEKQVRIASNAAKLPKLSFYWAVPYSIESAWKLKAPRKFTKAESEVVQGALACVDQFVLTIGKDPPHCDDKEDDNKDN
jgi:hypothetical protein